MKYLKILFLFLISTPVLAQESLSDLLNNAMAQTRQGSYVYVTNSQLQNASGLSAGITLLEGFAQDSSVDVRRKSYYLATKLSELNSDQNTLIQLSDIIVTGISDENSGIAGSCIDYLKEFNRANVSNATLSSLVSALTQNPPHIEELVRLVGYLNPDGALNVVSGMAGSDSLSMQIKWSCRLAMMRMGDLQYEDFILQRVQRLGVNDDVVYEVLPDLVYSRSPQSVTYLVELVRSDALDCQPADMEVSGNITCAYRVMEYLGAILQDFPYAVQDGELQTDDYPAALAAVRTWIDQQNGNYQLILDQY
ncbi:MAG: hypothetical protein NXI20_14605 [bacterium]|nr:hypothetical protein [bacterium]